MHPRFLTLGALILFACSSCIFGDPFQVQGHRGARGNFPENTLPAFDFALRTGANVLEFDLQVTKDLKVVVGHDPILNQEICLDKNHQPLKKPVAVYQLTFQELRDFDCGALKPLRFPKQKSVPGTPMPALDDVISLVLHSDAADAEDVRFNMEIKYDASHPELAPDRETFSKLVLNRIDHWKIRDRVIIQSFDFDVLKMIHQKDPELSLSYLSETLNEDRITRTIASGARTLSPDFNLLTEEEVRMAHEKGIKVVPWTLNSKEDWQLALKWKVDGIITDYPKSLMNFMKKQKSF